MDRYGRGKRFGFSFDGKELALLIGGISVICLLFYLFGLNVGMRKGGEMIERVALKQEYKGVEERPAAQQPEKTTAEGAASVQKRAVEEKEGKKIGLTFYETLPNKGEAAPGQTGPVEKVEPQKVERKKAPEVERGSAAKATVEVKKRPSTRERAAVQRGMLYTVQVGSFRDWSKAMALKRKLLKAGYRAYATQTGDSAKGTWFKIRVGNFRNKSEADKIARKLGLKENLPAFAVMVER